jgi:hypothetical protein
MDFKHCCLWSRVESLRWGVTFEWDFTVGNLAMIAAFAAQHFMDRATLAGLKTEVADLKERLSGLKDGGAPVLCRLHEDRLTRLEEDQKIHALTIRADVADLKAIITKTRAKP